MKVRDGGLVCTIDVADTATETIGDYATYQNLLLNISSTKPSCSYIMIDSNYYLAPVMENYFVKTETGRSRREAFFAQKSTLNFGNQGLSYQELALRNAEEVMRTAAPFAASVGRPRRILSIWRRIRSWANGETVLTASVVSHTHSSMTRSIL